MSLLVVENVSKRFKKEEVLKDFSLVCDKGEIIALLGPNGSGKSTTLRIIAGILRKNGGSVKVLGGDPWITDTRKNISYLPQRIEFPKYYRVRDVLRLTAEIRGEEEKRIQEMVERFSMEKWVDKYVRELSGGMIQRLALAVTFMPNVPLYLLDEPSNNLDFEGIQVFRSEMREVLKRGATVILSTHSLSEAETFATRVVMLWRGRIVREEPAHEFFERINRRRRLWIRLANPEDGYLDLLKKEADKVERHLDIFRLVVPPEKRLSILTKLIENGAVIKEFGLEEPELEEIYSVLL